MSTEENSQEHGVVISVDSPDPEHSKSKTTDTSSGLLSPHQHFNRKPSVQSEHGSDQHGPVRRKSILHNATHHDHHTNHHVNHGYHSTEEGK